jgi:outer membrane protein assembly factor BamD
MPDRRVFLVAGLLALLLLNSGCGVWDYFFLPQPEDTAQELFEAGQDAMQAKEYDRAAEYFSTLRDRYPFSPYTVRAELALGDAYFLEGRYVQAVEAYKDFESLHPRHEEIPYVLFQTGVASYKSVEDIDRPMQNVAEGLQYFYRLRQAYPDSPYAEQATEYILQSRRKMAEHEIFVADFYWRAERYQSAWQRYEYVAETFTDHPDIVEYANRRAELAYLRYQQNRSKELREEEQGSWKDLFDWL